MSQAPLPFATRLWFAWVCFFRALFNGDFAAHAFSYRAPGAADSPPDPRPASVNDTAPEPPASKVAERAVEAKVPTKPAAEKPKEPVKTVDPKAALADKPDLTSALQLLALLQREGRFVDFLEQDVTGFTDADVGAAARVVHEGCRKALRSHAKISPVRSEEEGAKVTIAEGYAAHEVKLIGNVTGKPPYSGVLQHRGWKVRDLTVPMPTQKHDASVIAPAEVEL